MTSIAQTGLSRHMDMAHVLSGDAYGVRKPGNEASISVKAVKFVGGIDAMARRLVALWLDLSDHYRNVGYSWYEDGNQFASLVADMYELTTWQVSQVIAVLSPQNPWDGKLNKAGARISDGNRVCTLKVIDAWFIGGADAVYALKGWGYAPDFLAKAIKVLQGEELDWSGAPKTHRFALLLANPKRTDIAVVDSHASRIATGNLGGRYHVVAASAYALLEKAYMQASAALGIPAYVLQAGTWQAAADGLLY